jgi:alanine racemase
VDTPTASASFLARPCHRCDYASIVGNISMDSPSMSPASGVEGDEVILLGASGTAVPWDHQLQHDPLYEVLCGISKRVPRTYLE